MFSILVCEFCNEIKIKNKVLNITLNQTIRNATVEQLELYRLVKSRCDDFVIFEFQIFGNSSSLMEN